MCSSRLFTLSTTSDLLIKEQITKLITFSRLGRGWGKSR